MRIRTLSIGAISAVAALGAAGQACAAPAAAGRAPSFRQPDWQRYVLGPATADVHPTAVQSTSGEVSNAQGLVTGQGAATLTMTAGSPAPTIVLDYGKDIGGIPSFQIRSETGTPTLTASYSEGLPYVSPSGDGGPSQSGSGDGSRADQLTVTGPGPLTAGLIQGGERYQALTLTSPGTVTISSAQIHFTAYRATPADYRGWFESSSDELNRLWYDGAYTTQLDQLPRNSLPTAWSIADGSLDANGGNIGVLSGGSTWADYTDAFQTEILSRQAGWVVRAAADASSGCLFILDADNDPASGGGPVNTLQELYFDNGNYQQIADIPLGVDLAPNTWHAVSTTLSGQTITISLDGRQMSSINESQLPSGIPALTAGTVGFREYPGERAHFRDLTVTSSSGSTLYSNPLADPSALADFAGPPVTVPDPLPVILDGAKRDRVVWSGDLGVEGPNVFYTTAADAYVRGSLQLLASYQNSNGAEQIAVRARDAGMDVVYEGIRLTPAQIASSAAQEGVHVIGLSILSGSHAELIPSVLQALTDAGVKNVPVVVGGIIPESDAAALRRAGVAAVYTPKDWDLNAMMRDIIELVSARQQVDTATPA